MSGIDDLFSRLPIGQIASKLGIDPDTAQRAVAVALPTILGGMKANADDPRGASKLEAALADHDDDGDFDLDAVDEAEGRKIVKHVFGKNQEAVADRLAGAPQLGGVSSGMLMKLLPLLAPFIMKYLGGMFRGNSAATAKAADTGSSGGGIGDILGGLLGGGGSGGGLGSILGGLLGGGGSGGGLGSILGGLFGGHNDQDAAPAKHTSTSHSSSGKKVVRSDSSDDADQGKSSGGGLMDILGDLLGGGSK